MTEVLHLPGQDLLVVDGRDGGEVLVPFVAAIVPEVDLDAGRVRRRPAGRAARLDARGAEPMRVDVVTIFPDYLAPLELSLSARRASAGCSTCACTTCATGPTTGTAPSTTRRTAAAPAW